MKELDKISTADLISYIKNNRKKAFIVWGVEDVIDIAYTIGFKINSFDAEVIIEDIDRSKDCNYGITWETIKEHISILIDNSTYQVEIRELDTGAIRTTNFCSLESTEHIKDYVLDDDVFTYGIGTDRLKSYVGNGGFFEGVEILTIF